LHRKEYTPKGGNHLFHTNQQRRSRVPSPSGREGDARHRLLLTAVLLVLSFIAALCFGSTRISLLHALRAWTAGDRYDPDLRILLYVRLPRACAAAVTGGGLACAGALIQAVLHNPMAAPNVIGVNAGAGLAAVALMALCPASAGLVPVAAFCGAMAACLLIYMIASRTGAGRMTLTLVGIAVSSMLSAGINTLRTICPDSIYDANIFMIGGLSGVTMARLTVPALILLTGMAAAMGCARRLDVLSLGSDSAAGLGLNVRRNHLCLLLLAAALAGGAVSIAGLLGFVGLVVPHIGRRLVGGAHRVLMPFCALGGGVLVLLCDLLGRVLAAPYELPAGILLSFLGGPFFIALILMQRKQMTHD
jgi:iron complex transport system permease protein